jgi:hypothetical protein
MSEEGSKSSHICDCAALHEIATTQSNNLKSFYIDQLKSGALAVPARVLKEFRDLYEDEAAELETMIAKTIGMKRAYQAAAARIVDKNHSGFPRRPYDGDTDLYTAAIASVEDYTIVTTTEQAGEYDGMECEVTDLATWVDGMDKPTKKKG